MRLALFLTFCFALICFRPAAQAQCPAGFDSVRFEIDPDPYFSEVHWKIREKDNPGIIYASGGVPSDSLYVFEFCLPSGSCKELVITDDNGDGMYYDGAANDGRYRLYVNGDLKRESIGYYGFGETTEFGCPLGYACNAPFEMQLGSFATPNGNETWYSFTPVDTGIYNISTCGAACPTKIWVYDNCVNIFISEDQLGAIFYANSGCPDSSASATLYLAGGKEYFVRLRYDSIGCSTDPIPYTLAYLGPIIGCTDPTACNYEPLATISGGTCIYPGDPNCPHAPDFWVNQDLLVSSLKVADLVTTDVCYVEEGCLRGTGNRYLIQFSTQIKNIGDADYYIGEPPVNPNDFSTQFVYDPCHHHWHYMGYADYILYNAAGQRVPIGSKTGFCVLDLECADGGDQKYTCVNMGISAHCGDVYDAGLPCQWIDITDIPADHYTMVVRVNWDKSPDKLGRVEKTYENNWAQACFSLTYDGNIPEVVFNTDSCQQFTDCQGVVFGDALPDCNGVCNGPALMGDLNQDTIRDGADELAYWMACLNNNTTASPCNDLHDDGIVNLFDAALLQECNLHADDPQHWIQRFACQFPSGFVNTQDIVTIQPGSVDTLAKTFDIEIVNPFNRIMGYEFTLSGLVIESVENLDLEHQVVPLFNPANGKILALAQDESSIPKNVTPSTFLRVHYASLTDDEVCVSSIQSVVNNKYQASNAQLGIPNCIKVKTVSVKDPVNQPFTVFVQPNPMKESSTIFFNNKNAEPMSFTLKDMTGRTLRSFQQIREESVVVEREGLPEGTYLFTIWGSRGSVSGKLLIL